MEQLLWPGRFETRYGFRRPCLKEVMVRYLACGQIFEQGLDPGGIPHPSAATSLGDGKLTIRVIAVCQHRCYRSRVACRDGETPMKRIMIDTNVYAAFKRNVPAAVQLFRASEVLGVSVVVLGELLAGFRSGTRQKHNRRELDEFLNSPRVHVFPMDDETAECYARVFQELKEKGRPIPTNDMWIAASAMRNGLVLFSHDGHFRSIHGLSAVLLGRE